MSSVRVKLKNSILAILPKISINNIEYLGSNGEIRQLGRLLQGSYLAVIFYY